jgi:hypothetical protein
MNEMSFTEEDKQKMIEFLNLLTNHAKFNVSTQELAQYFKALVHVQSKILPKIEANIFEVKRIIENKEAVSEEVAKEETKQAKGKK